MKKVLFAFAALVLIAGCSFSSSEPEGDTPVKVNFDRPEAVHSDSDREDTEFNESEEEELKIEESENKTEDEPEIEDEKEPIEEETEPETSTEETEDAPTAYDTGALENIVNNLEQDLSSNDFDSDPLGADF